MKKFMKVLSKLLSGAAGVMCLCILGANDVQPGGFIFLFKMMALCAALAIAGGICKGLSE